MVLKKLCVAALLAGALVTAAPAHAVYADDGLDYVNGQWSGWGRAYVSGNTYNEYYYNQGWWYVRTTDFNNGWSYQPYSDLYYGYWNYLPISADNLFIWYPYTATWIPIAQYLQLLLAQLQAQLAAQQQSGGLNLTIYGPQIDYVNAGANFGSFLDYITRCPTCPRLSPGPWLR